MHGRISRNMAPEMTQGLPSITLSVDIVSADEKPCHTVTCNRRSFQVYKHPEVTKRLSQTYHPMSEVGASYAVYYRLQQDLGPKMPAG